MGKGKLCGVFMLIIVVIIAVFFLPFQAPSGNDTGMSCVLLDASGQTLTDSIRVGIPYNIFYDDVGDVTTLRVTVNFQTTDPEVETVVLSVSAMVVGYIQSSTLQQTFWVWNSFSFTIGTGTATDDLNLVTISDFLPSDIMFRVTLTGSADFRDAGGIVKGTVNLGTVFYDFEKIGYEYTAVFGGTSPF
jgi:hypothetical protein